MPWIEPTALNPIFRVFRKSAALRSRVFETPQKAVDFLIDTGEDGYVISRDCGSSRKQSRAVAKAIQGEMYAQGGQHLDHFTIAMLIEKGYIQVAVFPHDADLTWAELQED